MLKKTIITSTDDKWIKGDNIFYNENGTIDRIIPWIQITDDYHKKLFWMLQPPYDFFTEYGMSVNKENAEYIQKIWEEDWVGGVWFFIEACYDIKEYANDVAKIIINELSSIANELDIHVSRLLEPRQINNLACVLFRDKSVDKRHTRTIAERLMALEPLASILVDPAFAKADNAFTDTIIAETLAENSGKLDGSDKMVNWMVGQVMKKAKGKADAVYIKEYLNGIKT